jgi:hypothetical protein
MIMRNPGVALLWMTQSYRIIRDGIGHGRGVLLKLDDRDPDDVVAYAEGRRATRDELMESIRTGLPLLQEMAMRDGLEAVAALAGEVERTNALFDRMAFAQAA